MTPYVRFKLHKIKHPHTKGKLRCIFFISCYISKMYPACQCNPLVQFLILSIMEQRGSLHTGCWYLGSQQVPTTLATSVSKYSIFPCLPPAEWKGFTKFNNTIHHTNYRNYVSSRRSLEEKIYAMNSLVIRWSQWLQETQNGVE
jgi:hypothetical protein